MKNRIKTKTIGITIVLIMTIFVGLMGGAGAINPPAPNRPQGPTQGGVNANYTFWTNPVTEPSHNIFYNFSWGDTTYTVVGPYDSGTPTQINASHAWTSLNKFPIKVRARDEQGNQSNYSPTLNITISDVEIPGMPTGLAQANISQLCDFSVLSIKAAPGHMIYYNFNWSDNLTSGWLGPYPQGLGPYDPIVASHAWVTKGVYMVRVQAKDKNTSKISAWSQPLNVTVGTSGPLFAITGVTGGIGVTATIQNLLAPSKWVNWTIEVAGGQITGLHTHKYYNGTVFISSGSSSKISTGAFFGLGKIKITVTAKCTGQKVAIGTYEAFVLLVYVTNIKKL